MQNTGITADSVAAFGALVPPYAPATATRH
ncbi:hypothetical protein DSM26151_22600 [Agromyces marinus]|nr:hypothetical protein DSM26151_22600 [Agromyces marinus]